MNYLIITSHPYDGSFNASIKTVAEQAISKKGHNVNVIDLIEDGFSPVMTGDDLKMWSQGKCNDPMVEKYQREIQKSDVIVFPFPIWWGAMPAVLKGFCDKVLLPGWAYRYGDNGEMIGMLTGKKAIVITTMETPIQVFNDYFNNPVNGAFIKDTLQVCGLDVAKHMEIDKIVSGGKDYTDDKMQQIANLFD